VPEVSIIIPTRERWDLLRETLKSALGQQGVDHEIIVVDDGSRSGPEGLDELADDRVTFIRSEERIFQAAARNLGIARAKGDWVAFLDDDDLWAPTKIRAQLNALAGTDAQFAYVGALTVDGDLAPLEVHEPPSSTAMRHEITHWNVIPGGASNVIARRALLEEIGGFDETFHEIPDWELWIRLSATSEAAVAPDILVALRRHAANRLVAASKTAAVAEFRRLEVEHRAAVDRIRMHHWVAGGFRRQGLRSRAALEYLRCARSERSPGNVLLACRVLLGERAMRPRRSPPAPPSPEWLAGYR
jgi:glycosyltransferase involved in cell wall biosynthesis